MPIYSNREFKVFKLLSVLRMTNQTSAAYLALPAFEVDLMKLNSHKLQRFVSEKGFQDN